MKKIEAYIKKIRFGQVIENLHEIEGLTGVSSFNINSFGRVRDEVGKGSHVTDDPIIGDLHVKLEIMCKDSLLFSTLFSSRKQSFFKINNLQTLLTQFGCPRGVFCVF